MNKYNNFPRAPGVDSTMRFNKRPRYGANSGGGNNSPRFKHQNQSSYQYSQDRNNATDYYIANQYENTSNRHFFSNAAKRSSYNKPQNKQPSAYSHKSTISSVSPFSKFSTSSHMPPSQPNNPAAQTAPATDIAETNQHQQKQFTTNIMDSSNYYGFGYNFQPNSYNAADGMSPYMWQTITSRPPPKISHQQQQQPHELPPLPPSSDNVPHLPPPPPIPESITDSPSATGTSEKPNTKNKHDQDLAGRTIVKMKAKRKAMSVRYKLSKSWSENNALLALKAEETNAKKLQKDIILIIRFPDPEISREIVKCYSPAIESVHFQLNFAPRYCLVHLKPGADVEKTIDELSNISFGTGHLSVEIKQIPHRTHSTKLNEIDPFTLYVGNLPTTIACKTLKEHFPGAARIDIGFAQRMKYTRYAFIRYQNVEEAIEAYKRMLDAEIGGRSLTIRFRRLTPASDGNKDGEDDNNDDIHDHLFSHTTVASNDVTKLSQNNSADMESTHNTEDANNGDNSKDLPNLTKEHTMGAVTNTDDTLEQEFLFTGTNLIESNEGSVPLIKCAETITQEKSSTLFRKVKPDPDLDPDDIVIRNITSTSRLEITNNNIKQEQKNLALYMEFFEKPNNQNDSCEKSNRSDINSLSSTTDETDTMSQLSGNNLGEFLQTCHMQQTQSVAIDDIGPPPMKVNKVTGDNLQMSIKREPLEKRNIAVSERLRLSSKDSVCQGTVKQETKQRTKNLNTIQDKTSTPQSVCSKTNRIDHLSRKKVAATNSSKDAYNNATNNDDIVPPTALFFTRDEQNIFSTSTKDRVYDEFYETRPSYQPSTNVKKEPFDTSASRDEMNKAMPQNETLLQSHTLDNSTLSKEISNKNATVTSDTIDDDDLVPAQNLLGSYRPLQNAMKRETEHDDLFSIPFKTTNRLHEALDFRDNSVTNLTSNSNNFGNTTIVSESYVAEDNDDDVVIIFDNIKSPPTKTESNNSVLTNLFIPNLPNLVSLVSLKHKPISTPNCKLSNLVHRYDLDKLYDQLDADSDSSDM